MTISRFAAALLLSISVARLAGQTQELSDPVAHVSEFVSVIEREWLYRERMDWGNFRRQVMAHAQSAKTIPDTYDAIRFALGLLGDKHSYYIPATGSPIFNPQSPTQTTGECLAIDPEPPQVPADVGYVRVQITPATPKEAIQQQLRNADRPTLVGWILDLRNSRGGNMWPAVAGLGSLLGEGTAGYFIDAKGVPTAWGYEAGQALSDGQRLDGVESPYRLQSKARVAVLTDVGVASSGEAIAIAFRQRPDTRSFGTPTCGLTTAVDPLPLKTGGRVALVTAVLADRAKTLYGSKLVPDEVVADQRRVIDRAIEWLRQR